MYIKLYATFHSISWKIRKVQERKLGFSLMDISISTDHLKRFAMKVWMFNFWLV